MLPPRPTKEPTDALLDEFFVLWLGDDVKRARASGPEVEGNHPGPQFVPERVGLGPDLVFGGTASSPGVLIDHETLAVAVIPKFLEVADVGVLSPNPPMDGVRTLEGVRKLQTRRSGLEFG